MKYNTKILIILILLNLLSHTNVFCQGNQNWGSDWSVSGQIGLDYFYGDANDNHNRIYKNSPFSSFYWDNKNFMTSITLAKQLNRYWEIRGHFLYGTLSGSNDDIKVSFKGTVYTGDIDITFNFADVIFKRPEKAKFKYYAFIGIGLAKYRAISRNMITNKYISEVSYADSTGNATKKLTTDGLMSFGLGIKYNYNKNLFFTFESSLRYVNSDKLDAYKSTYSKLEGFGFMSIGIGYKFNFRLRIGGSNGDSWDKSKGSNDGSRINSTQNKRKKRLKNRWK